MNERAFTIICLCMVFISGCRRNNCGVEDIANKHEIKLKRYFTYGRVDNTDVSTLISETRTISARLKASGMHKRANTFDSYIDVLTYGNRTIDESIRDVENLVKK